jgi:hypothetical protein
MARVEFNPAISSLSGRLGEVTYRHYADGTVIAAKTPRLNPDRIAGPAQLAWRRRFKDAVRRSPNGCCKNLPRARPISISWPPVVPWRA